MQALNILKSVKEVEMKFIVVTYSDDFIDKSYKEDSNERIKAFRYSERAEKRCSCWKEKGYIKDFKIFEL